MNFGTADTGEICQIFQRRKMAYVSMECLSTAAFAVPGCYNPNTSRTMCQSFQR